MGTTGSLAGEAFAFGVAGFRFLGDGDASLAVTGLLARLRLERAIGEEAMLYKRGELQMTVYEQESLITRVLPILNCSVLLSEHGRSTFVGPLCSSITANAMSL